MPKNFTKKKTEPNQPGPKFGTPDHFKGSVFSGGKQKYNAPNQKFNQSQFRIQHKG